MYSYNIGNQKYSAADLDTVIKTAVLHARDFYLSYEDSLEYNLNEKKRLFDMVRMSKLVHD